MSQFLLDRTPSNGHLLVAVGLCLFGASVLSAARKAQYPSSLPRVGETGGVFNALKGVMRIGSWLQEGYERYSKHDKAFVLPSVVGMQSEVVLPMSQLRWLVEQPDDVLSASAAHYDGLNGDYSFLSPTILQHSYHGHVLHRHLARNLTALIPALDDEVRRCMDDVLGADTEDWMSLNIWDLLQAIVPRLTNRVMIGEPLCRNSEVLDNMVSFSNDVVRNLIIFNFVPRVLRPLVGPLLGLANYYHYRKTAKHTLPLVKQRIADIECTVTGADETWEPPNDYITWHIRQAVADGETDELDPVRITMRLVALNFAAIHTTVLTTHSTLLDLLSADPARGYLDGIREEATRVLDEAGGVWSKDSLAKMYRTDSAIRESMRVSNFAKTLLQRKVVAAEGLTNPTEGWHIPYGATLSLPVHGSAHDRDSFAEPEVYDAFRFSRDREEYDDRPLEERDPEEVLHFRRQGLVATGNTNLFFGYGRHACPGRFLVADYLKMILAYLVLNYDLKPLPQRPPTRWLGLNVVPAMDARFEVKRQSKPCGVSRIIVI